MLLGLGTKNGLVNVCFLDCHDNASLLLMCLWHDLYVLLKYITYKYTLTDTKELDNLCP